MTHVVIAQLPPDQDDWEPDPFPGSRTAREQGCTCPILQPWPGRLAFAVDCPIHELQEADSALPQP